MDQIGGGEHGLLSDDPSNLATFGGAVESLLRDRADAELLGRNARDRAVRDLLGDRHPEQYGHLVQHFVGRHETGSSGKRNANGCRSERRRHRPFCHNTLHHVPDEDHGQGLVPSRA